MTLQKPTPGLRIFAGPDQYSRAQLLLNDTNQSWVGAGHSVSYSFTVSEYDVNPPINEFHLFLLPLALVGGMPNEFSDYGNPDNFRLQIVGGAAGTPTVTANLAWKTGDPNDNPTNVVLNITNSTMIGTWTLTFTSDTTGTLTAPGAAPATFSIPSSILPNFANPLAFLIGLQPNPIAAIGQHVVFTHMSTAGVAGTPVNTDWTAAGSIDTNYWSLAATDVTNTLVPVTSGAAWWLHWGYPDYNGVVETKGALGSGIPWKSSLFYTGSNTAAIVQSKIGTNVWALIPTSGLPSVDGTSNGVRSANAFFRLDSPGPAQ